MPPRAERRSGSADENPHEPPKNDDETSGTDTADSSDANRETDVPDGFTQYRSSQRVYARKVEEDGTEITANGPVPVRSGDYVVKDGRNSPTRVIPGSDFEDGYETE